MKRKSPFGIILFTAVITAALVATAFFYFQVPTDTFDSDLSKKIEKEDENKAEEVKTTTQDKTISDEEEVIDQEDEDKENEEAELSSVSEDEETTTEETVPEDAPKITFESEDLAVKLHTETRKFDLTATDLEAYADICGTEHEDGYFDELVKKFKDTIITEYTFEHTGDVQKIKTYTVTVIPNIVDYENYTALAKDFDQCEAGMDAYPYRVTADWLFFESACGTGYDDGSGKPIGCLEIKDIIKPTIVIE